MRKFCLTGALALSLAGAAHAAPPAGLRVEREVILMRHGVRPPTKAPAMPADVTPRRWPDWPAQPGWLTPHGGAAVARLGAWDGAEARRLGLIPARGCAGADTLRVIADSDQRTIETAKHWLAAAAPGCAIAIDHRPQDEADPRFGPLAAGLSHLDPAQTDAAVQAAIGPGGIAAVQVTQRPILARIDAILCDGQAACGVLQNPTRIEPAQAGRKPRMSGALDRGSTVAQILLLEYAEGKPMSEVGWGRATARDVADFSALHALEFRLLARPHPIAAANMAGLAPALREGLTGKAKVTLISGHDTQIAALGGLLDAHWHVPGLAADDPTPGGALVMTQWRGRDGAAYVGVAYRAQSLEQMRSAAALGGTGGTAAYRATVALPCAVPGTDGLCRLADFLHLLD